MPVPQWNVRQYAHVVHRFRDHGCDKATWDEVRISFAILIEKGPHGCGDRTAKKLKNGDGMWELIARYKNLQPRLLFYIDSLTLVFVHAFIKTGGTKDYGRAITLAKERRAAIKGGRAVINPVSTTRPH